MAGSGFGATGEVHVYGLADLNRALRRTDRDIRNGIRKDLRGVAEPVRRTAEQIVSSEPPTGIRNIGKDWSRMRIGIRTDTVYVAPRKKGLKKGSKKRPNVAPLLKDRMERSLDQHSDGIERDILAVVSRAEDNFSR